MILQVITLFTDPYVVHAIVITFREQIEFIESYPLLQNTGVLMEAKVLMPPKIQQTFQSMDEVYDLVSRSRPVQEHINGIRKARSADSIMDQLPNDGHFPWFSSRLNGSLGRKVSSERSDLTADGGNTAQNLLATVATIDNSTRSTGKKEHVVNYRTTLSSPDKPENMPSPETPENATHGKICLLK